MVYSIHQQSCLSKSRVLSVGVSELVGQLEISVGVITNSGIGDLVWVLAWPSGTAAINIGHWADWRLPQPTTNRY